MNDRVPEYALRGIALAIVIAALVDPVVIANRPERPVVVVTTLDAARNSSLIGRVAGTLNKRFDVSRVPVAGASASVVVGDGPPPTTYDNAIPAFAILSDTVAPSVVIERLDLPATVPSDSRVPVVARISVHGARGRSLDATLRAGSVVADHVVRRLDRDDSTLSVTLSFVPTSPGAATLRLTASVSGAGTAATADVATDVRDHRWQVLFYDPRPSWTSTFVRRSIERDPRFVVTSRVETSRGVSTDAGRPPARLDDIAALSAWDVVVVGAPEGLSATDVAGLDAYMRRRGGSVVFLLDQRVAAPYDRLTGVANWTSRSTVSTSLASYRRDSATLRASEIAFPSMIPAGATVLVGGTQPIVWETPVGAGRLVVSGALDAWRFRDPSTSGFEAFWAQILADVANSSPPPVAVSITNAVVAPGDWVDASAVVRSAAMSTPFVNAGDTRLVRASVVASLERIRTRSDSDGTIVDVHGRPPVALRFMPTAAVGEFASRFRAPQAPGAYRVAVSSDQVTGDASLVVVRNAMSVQTTARDLIDMWARARGGRAFHADEIGSLSSALNAAIQPPQRLENWHPMRSAWWMIPLALALSAEWWLRRRRGLP